MMRIGSEHPPPRRPLGADSVAKVGIDLIDDDVSVFALGHERHESNQKSVSQRVAN
jgi:hypothetical protein